MGKKTKNIFTFIFSIIIPPLGVLLTRGCGKHFFLNILMTLVAIILFILIRKYYQFNFYYYDDDDLTIITILIIIISLIPAIVHSLYSFFTQKKRLQNKIKYQNNEIERKNSTENDNNNIIENNIEENNKNENDIEKSNVNINIEITENEKKKKKRLVIFIKPKKYKRVRKSVKKEKVEVVDKPKIINLWGSVLFLSVVIGCFQLSIAGIISIIKNGKDDEIFDNINNQKDKDKLIEITTDLFNTDYYTMENPTETDTVSILTSFPTPSSSPSPSPSEVSFNDLEYSKTITEITPTPSIMSTSTQYINNKLIAFDDNTNKNNTIRYFNGDDLFYDITDDDNIIKYNINNDFVKRADDINDNTNDNAKDNNNEKEEKNEKDEKDKEKTKELILNIVVKVICYTVSFCLTVGYYKFLIKNTEKVFDYTFRISFVIIILFDILLIYFFGYLHSIWIWTLGYFLLFGIVVAGIYIRRNWAKRAKFSITFLYEALAPIKSYPSIFFISMLNSVFKAILDYFIIYAMYKAFIGDNEFLAFNEINMNRFVYILFLMFSYFYSSKVIESIVYVTSTTLYYYYLFHSKPDGSGNLRIVGLVNPSWTCFIRTITRLLGSICINALIMTFLDSLRNILNIYERILSVISFDGDASRSKNIFIKAVGHTYKANKDIVDFINYISDLFSDRTLNELAIYGKPLIKSSEDAFYLMKEHDDDLLFNDLIIKITLILGEIGIVLLSVIISILICACFGKFDTEKLKDQTENAINNGEISFEEVNEYVSIVLTGTKAIFSSVLVITDAAVTTLFMSICRDPNAITKIRPNLSKILQANKPENLDKMKVFYESFIERLESFND